MNLAVVWGLGHVGWSAACHLAAAGVRVAGIDLDVEKVRCARQRECPVPGLAPWIRAAGVDPTPDIEVATSPDGLDVSWNDAFHHVCVPTEREGLPSAASFDLIAARVSGLAPRAILIVESTVAPTWIARAQARYPDLRFAAAPRRDWFDAPDKHLGVLPRVVGADDPAVLDRVVEHLGRICRTLVPVRSCAEAALVKAVENDLRFVTLCYANELALRLGDRYDVRRLLELAASKWNIDLYRPSIGVGGHCLPVAGAYLDDTGGSRPILSVRAAERNRAQIAAVADFLAPRGAVVFFGLGYKIGAPFNPQAPAVWLLDALRTRGTAVGVFAEDDVQAAAAVERGAAGLPQDAFTWSSAVIPVATPVARRLSPAMLRGAALVLDNEAALERFPAEAWREAGIDYRVPGRAGWLESS